MQMRGPWYSLFPPSVSLSAVKWCPLVWFSVQNIALWTSMRFVGFWTCRPGYSSHVEQLGTTVRISTSNFLCSRFWLRQPFLSNPIPMKIWNWLCGLQYGRHNMPWPRPLQVVTSRDFTSEVIEHVNAGLRAPFVSQIWSSSAAPFRRYGWFSVIALIHLSVRWPWPLTLKLVCNVIRGLDNLPANFSVCASSLSSYGQTRQTDDVTL